MLGFKRSSRSVVCTWIALALLLCPLLAHGAEEEAAKGRGGGGGRGSSNSNGGKKPPKTVKIGGWNAPLWAVVLVPILVLIFLYGCIHSIWKRCFRPKPQCSLTVVETVQYTAPLNPPPSQYVPPHIIIYELPPATPSYPANKTYDKPAAGGEAQKYYSEPYGSGGMGYNTASGGRGGGYGYNNSAPNSMHTPMASGGGGGGYGYNNNAPAASPPSLAQTFPSNNQVHFVSCPPYNTPEPH